MTLGNEELGEKGFRRSAVGSEDGGGNVEGAGFAPCGWLEVVPEGWWFGYGFDQGRRFV